MDASTRGKRGNRGIRTRAVLAITFGGLWHHPGHTLGQNFTQVSARWVPQMAEKSWDNV